MQTKTACTTELWSYLQAQLLNHSIYGLVNLLLDSCVVLVPNKLFVLNDLQPTVEGIDGSCPYLVLVASSNVLRMQV